METPKLPIHYRYYDTVCQTGVVIVEQKFYPIRETPCFYFVLGEFDYKLHVAGNDRSHHAKRVGKNSTRSKCYPTKELALNSFFIRKRKQAIHAKRALKQTEIILTNEELIKPENFKRVYGSKEVMIPAESYVSNNFVFD
ncbi:hypothetical protein NVP1022O_82 [Vibrio phage 1.022.O._10N.286.45.A10]|nr:hypothetical protein NVP1022O_82 [Vibrio phage 1.022.O._10N.286.45.A10]